MCVLFVGDGMEKTGFYGMEKTGFYGMEGRYMLW